MSYNKASNNTTQPANSSFAKISKTLKTGGSTFPIIFSDQMWQAAEANSTLATKMGSAGTYTQEEINKYLLDHVGGGSATAIEVVQSTASVVDPSTTTLYLVSNGSGFDIYTYNGSAFQEKGSISIDLSNFISQSGSVTANNVAFFSSDKTLQDSGVSKVDLKSLVDSYKSEQSGSLGQLIDDYVNGNIGNDYELPTAAVDTLGGIKTGYAIDAEGKNYPVSVDANGNAFVNVPWQGNEAIADDTQSGLMSSAIYNQIAVYKNVIPTNTEIVLKEAVRDAFNSNGLKAFFAPMSVGTTNCLDIDTNSATIHVFARFVRTDAATGTADLSTKWECRFEIGANEHSYNCHLNYNGSSFTLLVEEYAPATSNINGTLSI